MELKGKLILKLSPEVGESAKGKWTKQGIVIETQDTYPKKILIEFWNDLVIKVQSCKVGDILTVDVNVESREYNNRWYTQIKAWKFTANGQAVDVETPKNDKTITENEEPNLPF